MPVTKYDVDVSELFLCIYFDVLLVIFNIFFFFLQMSAISLCPINRNKNTLQIVCSVFSTYLHGQIITSEGDQEDDIGG